MIEVNEQLEQNWEKLLDTLQSMVGKRPEDLNSVLFLIGVQELGKGPLHFTKEQKQDLMHIATCKVLSLSGFYTLEGLDKDGWPHWKLNEKLPRISLISQENVLREHVLRYFGEELGIFLQV